ncbi:MAG: tRNA (guanosine(37)-N1)-methyltransferase TrmD [Bacillota bacterium]|nr:MAG: tRNA (guanosine(37)-N1)-methyltransferase TrmD [Bacillota bacterium]
MRIDVLTLFPEMVRAPLETSMMRKARERGAVEVHVHNLRDWAEGKHHVTDDRPFGGGPGMVLKPEPIFRAADDLLGPGGPEAWGEGVRFILTTPQGRTFNQEMAAWLARQRRLVILCGHYEGVDERVRLALVTDEISIGDYVLTGGELPALVIIDAVVRLLPGVLAEGAAADDSFTSGLLEGPHYTRPRVYRGMAVPDILLSGDHGAIARWRREQALLRTLERRPDLLERAPLDDADRRFLEQVRREREAAREAGQDALSGQGSL